MIFRKRNTGNFTYRIVLLGLIAFSIIAIAVPAVSTANEISLERNIMQDLPAGLGNNIPVVVNIIPNPDNLSIVNCSPDSDPVTLEGISPNFSINTNQNCTISWYILGGLVDTVDNVTSDTYRNTTLPPGTYNLTAIANNENVSEKVVWNWTVIENLAISRYFPVAAPRSIQGEVQQFNVTINRPSNISWSIDGVKVRGPINDVKKDSYTNSTAHPGNHTVEVVAGNGTEKINHAWVWRIDPKPIAGFSVNISKGIAPLTVNFTDLSKNADNWFWDFGDGNTSEKQSPIHTYNKSGCYIVNLTASNNWASNFTRLKIVVTDKIESSLSIGNTTIDDKNRTIEFKVTDNVNVTDGNKTLFIENEGINLFIHSKDEKGFQNNSGIWSGNYSSAELDKEPENFTLDIGKIEVSFNASLENNLSNLYNANITISIVPGAPDNDTKDSFTGFALGDFAEGPVDIVYSMTIEKNGLNGTEVKDAWIVMSLPAAYVNNSTGGPEAFTIMSMSDDGEVTALETTYTLDTKRGIYIFHCTLSERVLRKGPGALYEERKRGGSKENIGRWEWNWKLHNNKQNRHPFRI